MGFSWRAFPWAVSRSTDPQSFKSHQKLNQNFSNHSAPFATESNAIRKESNFIYKRRKQNIINWISFGKVWHQVLAREIVWKALMLILEKWSETFGLVETRDVSLWKFSFFTRLGNRISEMKIAHLPIAYLWCFEKKLSLCCVFFYLIFSCHVCSWLIVSDYLNDCKHRKNCLEARSLQKMRWGCNHHTSGFPVGGCNL